MGRHAPDQVKLLQVNSLRKSAALVREAAEALRAGQRVTFPTECGWMQAHFPPQPAALHLAAEAPRFNDPRVALAADTFWPGPMWLRAGHAGAKKTWFVPSHPLALALSREVGEPLGASAEESGDVRLAWKEPPLGLKPSVIDVTGQPWRWLRCGLIERREFEWLTGTRTVLSGAALGSGPSLRPNSLEVPFRLEGTDALPYWRVDR